jgi:hypothetical protein
MSAVSFTPDLAHLGAVFAQVDVLKPLSPVQNLTSGQFNIVYGAFSFAIAAMFASALFFFNAQALVGQRYRLALLVTGIVVSIAGYHYFRIFNSWEAAYSLRNGEYLGGPNVLDSFRASLSYASPVLAVSSFLVAVLLLLRYHHLFILATVC